MIKIGITFLFAIICSIVTFGQNISLDELISLSQKNVVNVEEYLTNKQWKVLSIKQGEESKMNVITFSYNKSNYSDKAESFIKYLYSEEIGTRRINIQINNTSKYNVYLSSLKAKGVRLIDTKIENGSITKVYQGKTLTFMVSTDISSDYMGATSTSYNFFVLENSDYRINF